jgi:hypothetical protein
MSSGAFEISRYQCQATAENHPIRIQPETLAIQLGGVANAAPAGPAQLPSAQVSQSRRSLGINARTITFKFAEGAAPDGYKELSPITVPWLQNNAAFTSAVPGVTAVTAYGQAAILVSTTPEKVR